MKFQITIILLAAVFCIAFCQENADEDDKSSKSRQSRLIGRPVNNKQQLQFNAKTTSTTEAPAEGDYYDDAPIEEEPQPAPTTTTEAPKKTGIKGGVVRPFRSNSDLIESLKRRRQQAGKAGAAAAPQKEAAASTSAEQGTSGSQQGSTSRRGKAGTASGDAGARRFSSRGGQTRGAQSDSSSTEAPSETTKSSRLFRGRKF